MQYAQAPTIATAAAMRLAGQSRAAAGDSARSAREPEEGAGRQHHVQPGDRHDVVDPGGAQHVVGGLVDEPALARHERRRHGSGGPADRAGDPLGQGVPGFVDAGGEPQAPVRSDRRRRSRDGADQRAHGADLAKVGVAGEVVAARPGGLRRRQQAGRRRDVLAGCKARGLAHRDPHPPGPLGLRHALHRGQPQGQPGALVACLHGLDEAGDRRDGDALKHGRLDAAGPDHGGREAGEDGGERHHRRHRREMAPGGQRSSGEEGASRNRRPQGRSAIGLKEEQDAEAEAHGDPREEPPLVDLDREVPGKPPAQVEGRSQRRRRPPRRQRHRTRRGAGDPEAFVRVVFGHRFRFTGGAPPW